MIKIRNVSLILLLSILIVPKDGLTKTPKELLPCESACYSEVYLKDNKLGFSKTL